MPDRHISWSCTKCRKRFRSFREAENCEIDHIVKGAGDAALDDFRATFQSEPKNISPHERMK